MKNEIDRPDGLKVHFRIRQHIGEISFMRPKFIKMIEERYKFKYQRLKDMQTVEPRFSNKVRHLLNNMTELIHIKK